MNHRDSDSERVANCSRCDQPIPAAYDTCDECAEELEHEQDMTSRYDRLWVEWERDGEW